MFRIQPVQNISLREALLLTVLVLGLMSVLIIFLGASPHVPLLLSLLILIVYGLAKGVPYRSLEQGITEGAKVGISAALLFFFIGILIASWMIGGTIPTLIYAGFHLVTPQFYLAIVFVVCAIVGVGVGSSLTTVGTIGLAFIGISEAVDVSLAMTAGAIVSGAFFGDKMSPLSDTTNMASSIVQVDLFDHIKNMIWTTGPALIIAFILFAVLSPRIEITHFENIAFFQEELLHTGLIHWYSAVIPLLVLFVFSMRKAPALLALAAGSITALLISLFFKTPDMQGLLGTLYGGFESNTGVEEIDALLSRGGVNSMLPTIGIVLLALSLGGLLFTLGIIPRLLASIESMLQSVRSVITASALTAIGVNFLVGEQYLSILLTTETYQSQYKKVGLTPLNLARVAEDAGTVVNPLIPWSVCGVFITSVLGVSTLSYVPFAFFCLLCPILTILFGITGKTLTYAEKE